MAGTVIVGGGQAGFQCAASLRAGGYDERVTIVCGESHLPYQRPPLSKGYLSGKQKAAALPFRQEAYYADHAIDLLLGEQIVAIDPAARRIELASGGQLDYDRLALATGARNRVLDLPGADLAGVVDLRTRDDADRIRQALADAADIVVVGGGFIGLEIAAACSTAGRRVTVLEAAERVMGRAVPPLLSNYFARLHERHGVSIELGVAVERIDGVAGRASGVVCGDGRHHAADLVIVGIGVTPNSELAAAAGLECDNGICVDELTRTSDPQIHAFGDCASHVSVHSGELVRLESVQNAADQARTAAAHILGHGTSYDAVPWFWSDQFEARLQMVGLSRGCGHMVLRGDKASDRFSVFHFRGGRLGAIESINRPADHMLGRKLLAAGTGPTPDQAADEDFDLKSLLQS